MPKEHLYVHDSSEEPSPVTPAQRAFFRWKYVVGSYEYERQHGSAEEARRLAHAAHDFYEQYTALRDGTQAAYRAHDPTPGQVAAPLVVLRERPPLRPNEPPPEPAEY